MRVKGSMKMIIYKRIFAPAYETWESLESQKVFTAWIYEFKTTTDLLSSYTQ
jgi:hypothetical protein